MDKRKKWRSVKIIRRKGADAGRVAVEFEMTADDWAWMEELEDRRMIPLHDMLYSGFFQGMEREGWKNPDHVTTPAAPPPRTHSLRKNAPPPEEQWAPNVIPLRPTVQDDLDDDLPF